MIRVCCACRREINGEGKQCAAFGPKMLPREDESTGFCWACFEKLYGDLPDHAEPTLEPPKKERAYV